MKYPRTPHLPFSPGASSDDVFLSDLSRFEGLEVVVTEKLDGENCGMSRERIHARSENSPSRAPWRSMVNRIWSEVRHDIPDSWKLFGENMYAVHSLRYECLPSYFILFGILDEENNTILSWDETEQWASLLGLEVAPVIWRGVFNEKTLRGIIPPKTSAFATGTPAAPEGVVIRVASAFNADEFGSSVAKWVRPNHVQTDEHWTRTWEKLGTNRLASKREQLK